MSIALRAYQQESVYDLIPNAFREGHKRIIRCAPTGSGKSLEMAELTRLTYEKGKRTMLLTHRKELFKSTLAHIGKSNIPCAELSQGKKMPMGDWRILLAMEKTLWNVIRKYPESILKPDLIIVDEGHFNNFTKIIQHFSSSFVITFTATPEGKHISKLYTKIIDNIGIPELIEQKYLTPCKPYMMKDPEGFDNVKMKGNDFDEQSLFNHFNKANRYKGVLDEYYNKVNGLIGMVFCVNVEHTIETFNTFKNAGINSFIAHSKMSDAERDFNVREFESSSDGVMFNCGILTTGYSNDRIMWIGVDRALTSLPLWLQIQGRGSRILEGKIYFIVLDFGDNHTRLGLWNQPREWTLKEKKKNNKLQAAAVKNCPSCGAMIMARVLKCEYCGHQFEKPTHELLNGIMCEVESGGIPLGLKGKKISDMNIEDIANLQRTKKYKASYCWRIIRTMESEKFQKTCTECEGRSKVLFGKDLQCSCHSMPPCFVCENSCTHCGNSGTQEMNEEEKLLAPNYLSDYCKFLGYKNGWLFSQRKKIEAGEVGFRDYILK
ncbi:MAG: DEAD/DEAH box helicase family protein [Nitrososphaerales archaeon]